MSPVSPAFQKPFRRSAFRSGRAVCVALCSIVALAGSAVAEEKRFERPGSIGAAYVYASDDFDRVTGVGTDAEDGHGGTVWLSYRFNQWVASSVRAEVVHGFAARFAGDDAKTTLASGMLGVRLFPLAPITEGLDDLIEPYVEVTGGIGWGSRDFGSNLDQKDIDFVARFAAGSTVWVTDSIGVDLSTYYNLPTGKLQDLRYFGGTAGLLFRF